MLGSALRKNAAQRRGAGKRDGAGLRPATMGGGQQPQLIVAVQNSGTGSISSPVSRSASRSGSSWSPTSHYSNFGRQLSGAPAPGVYAQ